MNATYIWIITVQGSERFVLACNTAELAERYLKGLDNDSSTNRYHITRVRLVDEYVTA